MLMKGNPYGIENCTTVPNTINMMLCMSWRGVLRPFRNWPKNLDAEFVDIRQGKRLTFSTSPGEVVMLKILQRSDY